MALPNFLMVGAPKSGTTSLYHYLKQHPQVCMSERKEPNFFSSRPGRIDGMEKYESLFKPKPSQIAIGEASTSYLYDKNSPGAILRCLGPDVKIIIILRNPIDMAYALWLHATRYQSETLSFEDAIKAEDTRMKDQSFRENVARGGGWAATYAYTDRAKYAKQVKRYYDTFGENNVSVYIFEEFFSARQKSYKHICHFLGIDEDFVPQFTIYNPGGVPRWGWLKALRKNRPLIEFIKKIISFKTFLLLSDIEKKFLYSRKNLPQLDPERRKALWDIFSDDVKELEYILHRDLASWWKPALKAKKTPPTLPNFLIVGAAKAGTTSLYHYLKQHPQVCMSEKKEPNFFSSHPRRTRTFKDYRGLFNIKPYHIAIGEASTSYLYEESAPCNIMKVLGPEVKILIMLRNPIDTTHSLWWGLKNWHVEDLSFNEAVKNEERRLNDKAFIVKSTCWGVWPLNYAYARRGKYFEQVKRYLDTFGKERVAISIFEEFFSNPAKHIKDIYRFLGVSEDFVPAFKKYSPGDKLAPWWAGELRRHMRMRDIFRFFMLSEIIRCKFYDVASKLILRDHKIPPLSIEDRKWLWDIFSEDVHKLAVLTGKDLVSLWEPRQVLNPNYRR